MKCPKCHFEQPKDAYCVQCGVDIENYKPKPSTIIINTFKNPLLHLGVFSFCLILFFIFKIPELEKNISFDDIKVPNIFFETKVLNIKTTPAVKSKKNTIKKTSFKKRKKETTLPATSLQFKVSFAEISEVLLNELTSQSRKIESKNSLDLFIYPESIKNFTDSDFYLFTNGQFQRNIKKNEKMVFNLYGNSPIPLWSGQLKWETLIQNKNTISFDLTIKDYNENFSYTETIALREKNTLIITSLNSEDLLFKIKNLLEDQNFHLKENSFHNKKSFIILTIEIQK